MRFQPRVNARHDNALGMRMLSNGSLRVATIAAMPDVTPNPHDGYGDILRDWHVIPHLRADNTESGSYYIQELDPGMLLTLETAQHIAAMHNHWRHLDEIQRREWEKPGPEHYPSLEVPE